MAILTQSEMIQVVLDLYAEYPDGIGNKDVAAKIITKLNLTEDELRYKTSSGMPVYASRIQWAVSNLRIAGCINRIAEGVHRITSLGKELSSESLTVEELSKKLSDLSEQRELSPSYEWTKVYAAIADKLRLYRSRQEELVALLSQSFDSLGLKKGLLEFGDGQLVDAIDPFSFFAAFNRGITDVKRTAILSDIVAAFNIDMSVPASFSGIPVKLNFNARFVDKQLDHNEYVTATEELWDLFESSLVFADNSSKKELFENAYDKVLPRKFVSWGITMALYWVRPNVFIGLDENNRAMLEHDYDLVINELPSGSEYIDLLDKLRGLLDEKSFAEFSFDAWSMAKEQVVDAKDTPEVPTVQSDFTEPTVCWFLGAYVDGIDLVDEFVSKGEWRCSETMTGLIDGINAIPVGAKIALKKSFTRKRDIPFSSANQTISVMRVCARGTVSDNPHNGHYLQVSWDKDFEPCEWFLFNYQATMWKVERSESDWRRGALLDFVFNDQPQDFNRFLEHPFWKGRYEESSGVEEDVSKGLEPYSKEMFLDEVFLDEEQYDRLVGLLTRKLNVILQGAPGTGKTYAAKRLAYSMMGCKDDSHIGFKQFHQNTTYEDMVVGYRPTENGSFLLEDGAFVKFCDKAVQGPDEKFFYIIDEINRADVSRVFGELLMTIEKDHRNDKVDLRLANGRESFKVPDNVYIIAMMNTADRSIAMMDYALRRRFAFFEMEPAIDSAQFLDALCVSVPREYANRIVEAVSDLNEAIASDLGRGYRIGHSYLLDAEPGMSLPRSKQWLQTVIEYEIGPLLEEYWFDDTDKAQGHIAGLLELCK